MRDRIIEIRKEHHLSQEAFAKKLNLSRNFINQFENGNKNISDRTINDICDEFGLNEEWLKTGNGKKEKDIDVDYGTICTKISNEDPKAKEAIIKYFQLSKEDKELFWKFMERFVK
jgi:transcriptional regulator with XRE-family HTH domain